ncbi:MAG: hypothetical protein SV775_04700 [Thermodesulfobacteriota bacterium]|nr:hypothetical protein [Thermodesulfobacteriota bacterium]
MLEINYTIVIQIANFLFLLLFLNIILYRPIRRILIQRNEEVDSLQNVIEDYRNRSDENEKGLQEDIVYARQQGHSEKENLRGEGIEKEKVILLEVGSSVEEKIGKARSETESKMADVRKALDDQVSGFSRELAEKILGRIIK